MASACLNNIGMLSDKFLDCKPVKCPSYGWMSPRVSFGCEFPDKEASKTTSTMVNNEAEVGNVDEEKQEDSDPEISGKDFVDFEFRLEDPVKMLPADELFFDGKLVPLHLSTVQKSDNSGLDSSEVTREEVSKSRRRNEISATDTYLFSPKAPSCSGHWKDLLGLKKLYLNTTAKQEIHKTGSELSSSASHNQNRKTSRSVKQFLLRGSNSGLNSSMDSSPLTHPLLKKSDNESLSISSRLSLSSSLPHEHDDLPRHSLDTEKPISAAPRNTRQITKNLPRPRAVKLKAAAPSSDRSPLRKSSESTPPVRDASADSPRMISSGKILFHSLERSSSSPSTLNGGPRHRHRGGIERSNSAHVVRVTPVLNVPVCTLRGTSKSTVFGFPLFSSPQKKDSAIANRNQQHRTKLRTDRTS
ncbi:uncharacterized protein LOC127253184 [Andrographis paniculata]|uniref:uncharacterized protein LOC127253184 n=1 Tax=Andrographis paniculata TaxID=175694 RepID=UPI0021E784F2|nr:uncharacterized protein LOC127253184 [Andrographis paniculata]